MRLRYAGLARSATPIGAAALFASGYQFADPFGQLQLLQLQARLQGQLLNGTGH